MKYILTTCLFLLSISIVNAQHEILTFETTLNIQYSLSSNKFSLSTTGNEIQTIDRYNRLQIKHIEAEDGNMLIYYQVAPFPKWEKNMYLSFNLVAVDLAIDQELFALPYNANGQKKVTYSTQMQEGLLIWENWVNQIRPASKHLKLKITAQLISPKEMNCKLTVWNKKKWFPHLLGSGVGISLLGSSLILNKQSINLQKDYVSYVEKGEGFQTFYNSANIKFKTSHFLKQTGLYLAATSIITGTVRYIIYRQNKSKYDYYCPPPGSNLSLKPNIQWNGKLNDQLGLTLSYTF